MPFQQLDRVSDNTAPPNTGRVVADEHEKRQRQHVIDVRCCRFEQLGGVPVFIGVLHREDCQPVGDQDEHEDGHRQRQHEGCDPHPDGAFDLIAHLNGDRLKNNCTPPGTSVEVTLARR